MLQDFKIVSEYNFTIFKICSKLKLCKEKITEEDMLEKNVHYISPLKCPPIAAISRA